VSEVEVFNILTSTDTLELIIRIIFKNTVRVKPGIFIAATYKEILVDSSPLAYQLESKILPFISL
jgi:hypothetical protein